MAANGEQEIPRVDVISGFDNTSSLSEFAFHPPLSLAIGESVMNGVYQATGSYPCVIYPVKEGEGDPGVSGLRYLLRTEKETVDRAEAIVQALGNVGIDGQSRHLTTKEYTHARIATMVDLVLAKSREVSSDQVTTLATI